MDCTKEGTPMTAQDYRAEITRLLASINSTTLLRRIWRLLLAEVVK